MKYVRAPFLSEHHQMTTSDYSSTKRVKGELANETVNYDTKTKVCTNLSQKCKLPKRADRCCSE